MCHWRQVYLARGSRAPNKPDASGTFVRWHAGQAPSMRPNSVGWYFWPTFMTAPCAASAASARDHVAAEDPYAWTRSVGPAAPRSRTSASACLPRSSRLASAAAAHAGCGEGRRGHLLPARLLPALAAGRWSGSSGSPPAAGATSHPAATAAAMRAEPWRRPGIRLASGASGGGPGLLSAGPLVLLASRVREAPRIARRAGRYGHDGAARDVVLDLEAAALVLHVLLRVRKARTHPAYVVAHVLGRRGGSELERERLFLDAGTLVREADRVAPVEDGDGGCLEVGVDEVLHNLANDHEGDGAPLLVREAVDRRGDLLQIGADVLGLHDDDARALRMGRRRRRCARDAARRDRRRPPRPSTSPSSTKGKKSRATALPFRQAIDICRKLFTENSI